MKFVLRRVSRAFDDNEPEMLGGEIIGVAAGASKDDVQDELQALIRADLQEEHRNQIDIYDVEDNYNAVVFENAGNWLYIYSLEVENG